MENKANKIRAVIIDDEPFARDRVRRLLKEQPEIEVVGEAGDGSSAAAEIKGVKPDLVFLDVQMPGLNGFEVLETLAPEETPVVIFLTAYDQYAVRAFEAAALDYILKPFDEDRFETAVERAKLRLRETSQTDSTPSDLSTETETTGEIFGVKDGFLRTVLVKKGGRVYFFKSDEIEWIEAEGNYVRLHFKEASYVMRATINSLEEQLDPQKFVRVHRSSLVNLTQVREMQSVAGGRAVLVLESGAELVVSRRFNRKFSKLIGRLG